MRRSMQVSVVSKYLLVVDGVVIFHQDIGLLKLVEGPPGNQIAKSTDMFHQAHPTVPKDVENDTEE